MGIDRQLLFSVGSSNRGSECPSNARRASTFCCSSRETIVARHDPCDRQTMLYRACTGQSSWLRKIALPVAGRWRSIRSILVTRLTNVFTNVETNVCFKRVGWIIQQRALFDLARCKLDVLLINYNKLRKTISLWSCFSQNVIFQPCRMNKRDIKSIRIESFLRLCVGFFCDINRTRVFAFGIFSRLQK